MQQNFPCHRHIGIAVSVKISSVHTAHAMRSKMPVQLQCSKNDKHTLASVNKDSGTGFAGRAVTSIWHSQVL